MNYLTDIEQVQFNSGINGIDCIYVINLSERFDRWKRIENIFTTYGFFPNRVNAVNGWNFPSKLIEEFTENSHSLKKGEIGCLLSHLSILKHALENNFDIIWILEDDVVILDDPYEIPLLLNELSEIDPEWDIFYTDIRNCWHIKGKYTHQLVKNNDYINEKFIRVRNRYGCYSMIISKNGIKKILNHFFNKKLSKPIDVDIHLIPNIRKYSPSWNIVSWLFEFHSDTSSFIN